MLLVYGIPFLLTLYYSVMRYELGQPLHWVGAGNFVAALTSPVFWSSLLVTGEWVILIVPAGVVLSLLMAVLLNVGLREIKVYRAIVYSPQTLSFAAVALVWAWLYSPTYGPLNQILQALGLPPQQWLSDPGLALPAIAIASLWRDIGYFSVILLAALQNVPRPLLEAAALDGAGSLRRFWSVTLPQMGPAVLFVLMTWTIGAIQMFTQAYIMTGGGPASATTTVVYTIYRTGFEYLNFGLASAQSLVLLVLTLVLSAVLARTFASSLQETS